MRTCRELLARMKGMDPSSLEGWGIRETCAFACLAAARALRGLWCKARLGRTAGIVFCDRGVRLHHARHIFAGRALLLEEGCEIVGLSKRGIVFGDRCTVKRFATIRPTNLMIGEPGEGLRVGDRSNIGAYAYIGCSGFIEIGSNVMMGPRVNLMAENHVHDRTDIPMKDQGVRRSFIRIEDDCWLGVGSTVLAGVTVGQGSIVAAGAVVTRNVPPYSVVAGVPARVIASREGSRQVEDSLRP